MNDRDTDTLEQELRLLLKAKRSIERGRVESAISSFLQNIDHATHNELIEVYNVIVTRLAAGQ